MKYLLFFLLSVIVSLFAGCSDDSTGPNNTETVIFSQDSLVLYAQDTVNIAGCGVLPSNTYSGSTSWRLSYNAITNDSSIFSNLTTTITSVAPTSPPNPIAHINVMKNGHEINSNFLNNFTITRDGSYGVIYNTSISFDTSYQNQNKYIKLYNIRLIKIN
jgi:hypothetical protein